MHTFALNLKKQQSQQNNQQSYFFIVTCTLNLHVLQQMVNYALPVLLSYPSTSLKFDKCPKRPHAWNEQAGFTKPCLQLKWSKEFFVAIMLMANMRNRSCVGHTISTSIKTKGCSEACNVNIRINKIQAQDISNKFQTEISFII